MSSFEHFLVPSPDLLSPRYEVEFEYFWTHLSEWMKGLRSEEELDKLKFETQRKDVEFYRKVYSAVDAMAQDTTHTTICLFDVDGTLGEMKEEMSPVIHTLLRPAAPLLISNLAVKHPEYLRFGILSNRPQDSLDEEIENPTFLSPVRPFLDKSLIFSSKDQERTDAIWRGEYNEVSLNELLASLSGIVDGALLDATARGGVDIQKWYDPKIKMITEMLRANPGINVVCVDNLPYTSVFDPFNYRVKGINVSQQRPLLLPVG